MYTNKLIEYNITHMIPSVLNMKSFPPSWLVFGKLPLSGTGAMPVSVVLVDLKDVYKTYHPLYDFCYGPILD